MNKTIKLLIADDHPIFRQGVRAIAEQMDNVEAVAEAEDGHSALEQLRVFLPDVLLLDLSMPGMDGLAVLEVAGSEFPKVSVVIITSYKDKVYLQRALKLGARGFVLKDDAGDNLVDCVSRVIDGEIYVSPEFDNVEPLPSSPVIEEGRPFTSLTRAECRVLSLVSRFMTSKEIAAELNISYRTVQNHRANITRKLGIKGIHQLAQFAHEYEYQLNALFDNSLGSKNTKN